MSDPVLKQPFIDYSFSPKAQERAQKVQDAGRLTIRKHFNSSLLIPNRLNFHQLLTT